MPTAKRTILFADDELVVRASVGAILRREEFEVLEAVDGADALTQLLDRRAPVDLLLTDIRMPQIDGIALARRVNRIYPGTPVLYISAYPFSLERRGREPLNNCAFLAKPFNRKALLEAVGKCLGSLEYSGRVRSVGG
jgi:two-component system cell cycle sensor histidine kinase/response regulator CckA